MVILYISTKKVIIFSNRKGGLMLVDEMVVVAEYNTAVEAEMAKSLLACAGIRAEIENEYMTMLYPGVIRARLMVDEGDFTQARILLRIRE